MTLLEKRMLEKKAGNFLTDADIRNIFNQFDRFSRVHVSVCVGVRLCVFFLNLV